MTNIAFGGTSPVVTFGGENPDPLTLPRRWTSLSQSAHHPLVQKKKSFVTYTSSWEGCPETGEAGEFDTMPHIICAFSQSTAIRKLVPYLDENGTPIFIQKIFVGSADVGPPAGTPAADEDNPLWSDSVMQMTYLEKVGDLPAAPSPEIE